jgi:hypothetical protein
VRLPSPLTADALSVCVAIRDSLRIVTGTLIYLGDLFRLTPNPSGHTLLVGGSRNSQQLISRCVLTLLLGGAVSVALCQTPERAARVPDTVLYNEFFGRVIWLDDIGRQIDAKGSDGTRAKAKTRRQAGLTVAEEATLKIVAKKWQEQNRAIRDKLTIIRASGVTPDSHQLEQIIAERRQIVLDGIAELRTLLGPTRFAQLDGYVRLTSVARPPLANQPPGGKK